MRIIIIVACASILCASCSLFKMSVQPDYCVNVGLVHETGTIESLVCAGEEISDVIKKVEAETGFDIWEAVFKQTCKKAECSEVDKTANVPDSVKDVLTN
jgi:hypothetical protein